VPDDMEAISTKQPFEGDTDDQRKSTSMCLVEGNDIQDSTQRTVKIFMITFALYKVYDGRWQYTGNGTRSYVARVAIEPLWTYPIPLSCEHTLT
jgi:hypothetical protein